MRAPSQHSFAALLPPTPPLPSFQPAPGNPPVFFPCAAACLPALLADLIASSPLSASFTLVVALASPPRSWSAAWLPARRGSFGGFLRSGRCGVDAWNLTGRSWRPSDRGRAGGGSEAYKKQGANVAPVQ